MYQKESFQSKSDDTHDYYEDHVEITTTRRLVSLSIPLNPEDFDEEGNADVLCPYLLCDQPVVPINETHGAIYELPE